MSPNGHFPLKKTVNMRECRRCIFHKVCVSSTGGGNWLPSMKLVEGHIDWSWILKWMRLGFILFKPELNRTVTVLKLNPQKHRFSWTEFDLVRDALLKWQAQWCSDSRLQWVTHCDLLAPYIWVKFGSGNGLLPDGTEPLPERKLTYQQWSPVTFI